MTVGMTRLGRAGRRAGAATALAVVGLLGVACSSHSSATATTSAATTSAEASSSPSPSPSPSPVPSTHPPAASTTAVRTTTSTAKRTPVRKTTASVRPAVATDPLTGGKVSANKVVVTKIDNTYFDTAQFGVSDADIVFVEQVEGGLTRLICVFHSDLGVEVGPVRSTRTTDLELLPVFGAKPVLVFSGANDGILNQLHETSIIDSSGFNGYFRSDAASGTYNLHANLAEVADQATDATPARYIGLTFAASDPRVAKGAPVSSIQAVMESGETDFTYSGGKFVRMRDGAVVHDYSGAVQAADNVLVMHVIDQPDGYSDSVGSPSYISSTVGSGQVTLYRDGHAVDGTWSRTAAANSFTFTDGHGGTLPMKPGHTWIILAPQTAQISTS